MISIGAISKDPFKKFIEQKFKKTGMVINKNALDTLLDITDGHPYYTQLLCRELYFYALTQNKQPIDKKCVKIAFQEAVLIEDLYFSKIWEEISGNSAQLSVLKATVEGKESLYNKEMQKQVNVARTLNQLTNRGMIKKNLKGQYQFVDPLFAEFLKNKLG